ncbi:hypothetical protein DN38_3304 [Vibrio cholerae]|nr:hypothetical protein DN38_3304 [Vibrio cholerae]
MRLVVMGLGLDVIRQTITLHAHRAGDVYRFCIIQRRRQSDNRYPSRQYREKQNQ